jgi:hypothetical protein
MAAMYPFNSIGQVLSYYNNSSPVRLKSINILERDKGEATHLGFDHGDLHAAISLSIRSAIDNENFVTRFIFYRCLIFNDLRPQEFSTKASTQDDRLHLLEAADELAISQNVAKRIRKKILTQIEEAFVKRELIPPLD